MNIATLAPACTCPANCAEKERLTHWASDAMGSPREFDRRLAVLVDHLYAAAERRVPTRAGR